MRRLLDKPAFSLFFGNLKDEWSSCRTSLVCSSHDLPSTLYGTDIDSEGLPTLIVVLQCDALIISSCPRLPFCVDCPS